jgi:hypothetical protein
MLTIMLGNNVQKLSFVLISRVMQKVRVGVQEVKGARRDLGLNPVGAC